MIAYLSEQWIDGLAEAAKTVTDLGVAPIAVTVVVDDVDYHLAWDGAAARAGRGPVPDETVRLALDRVTAEAIAAGTLNAQRAFVSGRLTASGATQRLLDAQPLFAALDATLGPLRAATERSPRA